MADLFISYSREDKPRAEQVARGLGQAGFEVFWDTEIPPGQTWADYIEAKLSNCSAVVVLWSQHSTKSQWVREEARMGKERGKLIPAMLDNSPPPFGFGEVQAANLSTWQGQMQGHADWESLVTAVRSAIARDGGTASADRPRPASPQPFMVSGGSAAPRKGIRPIFLIGGGVVAAALVALGVLGAMNGGKSDDSASDVPAAEPQQVAAPTPAANVPQQQTSPYAAQIQQQLAQVEQTLATQGFHPIAGPFSGGLPQGQSQTFPVTLQQGGDYRIVGVCDNDCPDLDLSLRDQNNNVINQDTQTDSMPVVQSQPAWTGPFMIDVTMYQCTHAPCYFTVVVYGRPTG